MKKKFMGGAVLLSAALLTGCGNEIPEMSQQQQELFVEYAVGKTLKYDKNHESRLVELTLEEETGQVPAEEEVSQPAPPEEEGSTQQEQTEADVDDVEIIDNTDGVVTNPTIEEFLGLDSVKFTYTGYETVSTYPEQEGELFFAMDATEGNQLVVLKFLAENISGGETALDIMQSNTRFKIAINGTEKNALTTLLLNDLAYYQGTLAPGEGTELVLVCEVPSGQVNEITTLGLTMKNGDMIATIGLN